MLCRTPVCYIFQQRNCIGSRAPKLRRLRMTDGPKCRSRINSRFCILTA